MEDRNLLTEKLLAEGYTKDNHPDYVRWYGNMQEFEYTPEYLRTTVWEAPCGVMRKGEFTNGYGWTNGVCWRVENNNYNYHCPYRKKECEYFHPLLSDTNFGGKCSWHMTDKPYNYENSAEKIEDGKRLLIRANLEKKFGHPSMIHCACCHINEDTCEVYLKFSPRDCINFMHNGCDNPVCHCTGKERNLKKANIYYDVKVTTEYREGFIREERVSITKGKKLFNSPKATTDLELYLKAYPDAPYEKEKRCNQHRTGLFNAEYYGIKYDLKILNIRIENRPERDLMQDLQDIKEGITVNHESDKSKAKKEAKHRRKAEAYDKKIARLEKKILELGYDGMESIDRTRVDKWIDWGRVAELEAHRNKPKPVEPVQMTLADFMKEE